jgi:hypothetical protein
MTVRDASTRPNNPRRTHDERFKDEVYRHMFRLEASRPGADLDLAVALVRALRAQNRTVKGAFSRCDPAPIASQVASIPQSETFPDGTGIVGRRIYRPYF